MKKLAVNIDFKNPLTLAKIASFLGLLCLFQNFYFFVILNNFPTAPRGILAVVGLFSLSGVIIGALLCQLFLPSLTARSGIAKKPLIPGIIFIVLIMLPNIILRSFGVGVFFSSLPVRAVASFLSGMLYPVCVGLFFLTHKKSKFTVFLFSLVYSAGYMTVFFSLPLFGEETIWQTAEHAAKLTNFIFSIIRWLKLGVGVMIIFCLFFLSKVFEPQVPADGEIQNKPNWPMILRLIGIASIFSILNLLARIQTMPSLAYSTTNILHPFFITVGLGTLILAFLAGRSIEKFIKWAILPIICLFILIPCVPLFKDYPVFLFFMNILVGFFNHVIWIIFTSAVIKFYGGGFWYYSISSVIYLTFNFTFLGMIVRVLPEGIEFSVLIAALATIIVLALSYRILFPKLSPLPLYEQNNSVSLDEIFTKHKLTDSEKEVAHLMVGEGLTSEEISNKLFRTNITIKKHITNIYQKFKVKNRAGFMALFVKK